MNSDFPQFHTRDEVFQGTVRMNIDMIAVQQFVLLTSRSPFYLFMHWIRCSEFSMYINFELLAF